MKKRIIGIILMCIVFIPITHYGGSIFRFTTAVLGMLGLKELLDFKETKKKIPVFVKFLSFICTSFIILSSFNVNNFSLYLDYRVISIIFIVFLVPLIIYSDINKYNITDAIYILGMVLLIGFVFNLIIFVREYDLKRFIYLLAISIATDSFAYVGGSLSGREKLCPKISPKKSIVGLVVGVLLATAVASTVYFVYINDEINIPMLILVTSFLSIISQLGDLVFSSIKRYFNRKDFSNLILGHGGVLDRFDGFVFVILGYIYFISVL